MTVVYIPSVMECDEGEVLVVGKRGVYGKAPAALGVGGTPGPTGPQGAPGPPGADGAAGTPGAASTVPGPQGPQGEPGEQGPAGDEGPAGTQGDPGTPGGQGIQGIQGVQGNLGAPGASGYMAGLSKNSDQTGIGTSLVDVTGLTVAVLNGQRIRFRAILRVTSSATGIAAFVSCNGPSASIVSFKRVEFTSATAFTTTIGTAFEAVSANTAGPGATVTLYEISGFAKFTANGAFALRVKAETGGTMAVLEGSWMEYNLL